MSEERRGHIPLECLGDNKINIRIPGLPRFIFPPSEVYLRDDGTPRRIEWVRNEQETRHFINPVYNRPGKPALFRVAADLVTTMEEEEMRRKVGMPEVLERLSLAEARLDQLEGLSKTAPDEPPVDDIEAAAEAAVDLESPVKRGRGRPRTKNAE